MKLSCLKALPVLLLSAFSLLIACGDDPLLVGQAAMEDPASRVDPDRTSSSVALVEPAQLATVAPTDTAQPPANCTDATIGDIVVEVGESFAPDGIAVGEITPCQVPSHRGAGRP